MSAHTLGNKSVMVDRLARKIILDSLVAHLLENPALQNVFQKKSIPRGNVLKRTLHAAEPYLRDLDASLQLLLRFPNLANLDVKVKSEELEEIDEYELHSLRVKAQVRNYKWVIVEGEIDQQLLPED